MNATTASNTTSAWNELALTINGLLATDPVSGLFVVFISLIVFFAIIIGLTWAITKILRSKNPPTPLNVIDQKKFSIILLDVIEEISKLHEEGRDLSAKHERIREHSTLRDQMTIVDNTVDHVHSLLVIEFSNYIRIQNPDFNRNPTDFPTYKSFEYALTYALDEIKKMFRRVAKENHLAEKNEQEFFFYAQQKIEQVKTMGRRFFESVYYSETMPIELILKDYDNRWSEYEKYPISIIKSMRDISIKYKHIIEQEEAEYKTRWSNSISKFPEKLQESIVTSGNK